jgi:hypothetical protein
LCGGSAAGSKEAGEHRAAFVGEDVWDDFDAMIEGWVIHYREHGAAGAGLGVGRRVNQPSDARVENRTGAHGAGFECDVQCAAFAFWRKDAVIGESSASFTEGYDLGVRCGVVVAQDAVVTSAKDLTAGRHDERANRNFTGSLGGAGFGYGESHEMAIEFGGIGHAVTSLVEMLAGFAVEGEQEFAQNLYAGEGQFAGCVQTKLRGEEIERAL